MNWDLTLAILFYVLVVIIFIKGRKNVETQGKVFFLYRTKLGLKLMNKIAGINPFTLKLIGLFGVLVGFAGMVVIFYFLLKGAITVFVRPDAPPSVAPLLPGIEIVPGVPALSFWYWIISILIVAAIHEFSHGVYARAYNVKVKSSGFAFLGPIPAAFVEPDEKEIGKKGKLAQLSIFAAGPFSNIVLAVILGVILFSFVGIGTVQLASIDAGSNLALAGAKPGDILFEINNIPIGNRVDFVNALKNTKPGDEVVFETNSGTYNVITGENQRDSTKSFFGIDLSISFFHYHDKAVHKYGSDFPSYISWIVNLFVWVFIISLGVGLFNLLPLGPIDGGRMLLSLLSKFTKNEIVVKRIWGVVSYFCLALIIINLLPFIMKLINFIISHLM